MMPCDIPATVKAKLPPPKFRPKPKISYHYSYLSWYRKASRMALSESAAEVAAWGRRGSNPRMRETQEKVRRQHKMLIEDYAASIAWMENEIQKMERGY